MIAEASASKGGFFHHFRSKNELGLALLELYAEGDTRLLEELMAAAEAESDDPAEQLVAFVRHFEQVAAELPPSSAAACSSPSSTRASWPPTARGT